MNVKEIRSIIDELHNSWMSYYYEKEKSVNEVDIEMYDEKMEENVKLTEKLYRLINETEVF